MDYRERIIRSAARLFEQAGYRGATTRRIAHHAGVNEVTLFRHFGSKDELIRTAIEVEAGMEAAVALPAEPGATRAELVAWSTRQLEHLRAHRAMVRRCLGEAEEHPAILEAARDRPRRAHAELLRYLQRTSALGLLVGDADVEAAAALLMGVLFADAMGRDVMPELYPGDVGSAAARYVDVLLRAIGATGASGSAPGGRS